MTPQPLVAQPAAPAQLFQWCLPSMESSLPFLRRQLMTQLAGSGLSQDDSYDLLLAVGEAASNAIEHAQDPPEPFFDVVAEVSPNAVVVTVRDRGQWLPPTVSVFRGRGLQMMRVLADTTVTTSASGTTVTIRALGVLGAAAAERTERAS